jgi:hypothetical protein
MSGSNSRVIVTGKRSVSMHHLSASFNGCMFLAMRFQPVIGRS